MGTGTAAGRAEGVTAVPNPDLSFSPTGTSCSISAGRCREAPASTGTVEVREDGKGA